MRRAWRVSWLGGGMGAFPVLLELLLRTVQQRRHCAGRFAENFGDRVVLVPFQVPEDEDITVRERQRLQHLPHVPGAPLAVERFAESQLFRGEIEEGGVEFHRLVHPAGTTLPDGGDEGVVCYAVDPAPKREVGL